LLIKYNVDLVLWGHVHAYERTCAVRNYNCVSGGPVHITIGMAGNDYQVPWQSIWFDKHRTPQPDWSLFRSLEFGFSYLQANRSHLLFQFMTDQDNGGIHDQVTLVK